MPIILLPVLLLESLSRIRKEYFILNLSLEMMINAIYNTTHQQVSYSIMWIYTTKWGDNNDSSIIVVLFCAMST